METRDRVVGCLLGGALGDALGEPVEFMSLGSIKQRFGPSGIKEPMVGDDGLSRFTDDTQMTLFSAEGVARAKMRWLSRGICHGAGVVRGSYQRWLHTQGEACDPWCLEPGTRGWLVDVEGLHRRMAPGLTCLSALLDWKTVPASNQSKGCGAVMRSAPMAMVDHPFGLAVECAALTHGHPEGQIAAGIFAQAVGHLFEGVALKQALLEAKGLDDTGSLSAAAIDRAVSLYEAGTPPEEAVEELGEGWVAEEALGIAAFCALRADGDFQLGTRLAVNHEGDSDSTGAMCGNLLGAAHGVRCLPTRWLDQLDMRDVVETVAEDLWCAFAGSEDARNQRQLSDRYPGS